MHEIQRPWFGDGKSADVAGDPAAMGFRLRRGMGIVALILLPLGTAILALGPGGCSSSLVAAVGPNQDIELFSDFARSDSRTETLLDLLNRPVATPVRPESPYKVFVTDSTSFGRMKSYRTLVILGDLSGSRWGAETTRSLLGRDAHANFVAAGTGHVFVTDAWADGQTVLCIHAPDREAWEDYLARQGTKLLAQLDEKVIDGLGKTLFISGEQQDLAAGIAERHGYRIRVPREFFVEEHASNRFVRMKKILPGEPVLFLFIYYEKQRLENDDRRLATYCAAVRDTLANLYFGGDRVDSSRTRTRHVRFAGHEALEIYGLYQNDNPPMGGPFKIYCFHAGGRLYLIDLAVFNPPGKKLPQLRILEAIAETFELLPTEAERASGPS
ncbi:MAG: DUF4837 family protein [Candidatus Eisenbacteria sp.]|nr:DUF4837 family protein [Candidatus Eisenbacteria bacterium]